MRAFSVILALLASLALSPGASAGERVPQDQWMRFADPTDAGFDPARLAQARQTWEELPSSAFLVVAEGAVVAAWGDVERRFMCHSVRKSFLSALYGIYWDRGAIELNKTLADLGIDDEPDPLLETEKQARILDLLKARSGVFHPAAYAGRTDSQPRGSQGPGRYFAYNNWDFNTLATILMQETGDDVFAAFDRHFGLPLAMEDWRVSDGYYHYETDKSRYPAYPFRMSARDAARFGLLLTRDGRWGDTQILSRQWVRRSSALYSIDSEVWGYGFMWWIAREPRFADHGMFAALGVGNQMIAALPEMDLVVVNRADTYRGEATPSGPLLDLVEQILEARTGEPAAEPVLLPLETAGGDAYATEVTLERLAPLVGTWPYPPLALGLPAVTSVEISVADGALVAHSPRSGTYRLYLQEDGSLREEDSRRRYVPIRDTGGELSGIAAPRPVIRGAMAVAAAGESERARELLAVLGDDDSAEVEVGRAILELVEGNHAVAEAKARALAARDDPRAVEGHINGVGYGFVMAGKLDLAQEVFALNTRVFPEAFNAWDSLGEAHMGLGQVDEAIRCYQRSLELNPENRNAEEMIARMREGQKVGDAP